MDKIIFSRVEVKRVVMANKMTMYLTKPHLHMAILQTLVRDLSLTALLRRMDIEVNAILLHLRINWDKAFLKIRIQVKMKVCPIIK